MTKLMNEFENHMEDAKSSLPRLEGASQMDGKFDYVTIVVAAFLVIALLLASLYGIRFGTVDESVVPGESSIIINDKSVLKLAVNDELDAVVTYRGNTMHGQLKLAGADIDTILYQLRDFEFADESDVDV